MNEILPKTLLFRKFRWLQDREVATALLFSGIVVLVGISAFGLGRLTAIEGHKTRPVIYTPTVPSERATPTPVSEKNTPKEKSTTSPAHTLVGSKNGTKYYPAACPGAARIKVANQVWFASVADAVAAGYTPASGCSAVQ